MGTQRQPACEAAHGREDSGGVKSARGPLDTGVQSVNGLRMADDDLDAPHYYRLLRLIEAQPEASQRQLARETGISLGKVNYCLKALLRKGVIKVQNFSRSDNKRAYAYYLTPEGMHVKARLTREFFRRVEAEYEELRREVERLEQEGV